MSTESIQPTPPNTNLPAPRSTSAILAQFPWWGDLSPNEQSSVQTDSEHLASALIDHGYTRMMIGECLTNIQSVLEPKGLFTSYCAQFHFSLRTAYRYISGFKNARQFLSDTVLRVALASGVNMIGDSDAKPLGPYTEAAQVIPPPANPSTEQAREWLDEIEVKRIELIGQSKGAQRAQKESKLESLPDDALNILRELYRVVSLRVRQLPNDPAIRLEVVTTLTGALLHDLKSGAQTIKPMAAPKDWIIRRGRPKNSAESPKAA